MYTRVWKQNWIIDEIANLEVVLEAAVVTDSDFYQMLLTLLSLHQTIQWIQQTAWSSFRIV